MENDINNDSELPADLPFDKSNWMLMEGMDYPFRDAMLKDLMSINEIRHLNKEELINFIGEPNRIDGNYLFYMIVQKRIGLFPLHTKSLVVVLAEDGSPTKMLIHK